MFSLGVKYLGQNADDEAEHDGPENAARLECLLNEKKKCPAGGPKSHVNAGGPVAVGRIAKIPVAALCGGADGR